MPLSFHGNGSKSSHEQIHLWCIRLGDKEVQNSDTCEGNGHLLINDLRRAKWGGEAKRERKGVQDVPTNLF